MQVSVIHLKKYLVLTWRSWKIFAKDNVFVGLIDFHQIIRGFWWVFHGFKLLRVE